MQTVKTDEQVTHEVIADRLFNALFDLLDDHVVEDGPVFDYWRNRIIDADYREV